MNVTYWVTCGLGGEGWGSDQLSALSAQPKDEAGAGLEPGRVLGAAVSEGSLDIRVLPWV